MIDYLLKLLGDSWYNILEIYYQIVLCFGTLLVAFYVALQDKRSFVLLIKMISIWFILEGITMGVNTVI